MFKLLLIIICLFFTGESCPECNKTYVPPCNTQYPFGDENSMNTDVTLNDTNMIVCKDPVLYTPEYGRCPYPPENPDDLKFTDPYLPCPEFPPLPIPSQIPPGEPLSSAEVLCRSCDVKVAQDGGAVTLNCLGCHDLPNAERSANITEKELLYTVYYVGIDNYTSVTVSGTEHFSP